MQATIERATPLVSSRRVRPETPAQEAPRAYRAPLATFLVLVASARASAGTVANAAPCHSAGIPDADV